MIVDFSIGWAFSGEHTRPLSVNLPHDAMLAEKRDAHCHNGKQSGFFPGGKYTYQKSFQVPADWVGKKLELLFEGVYQNCCILINWTPVCSHKYGRSLSKKSGNAGLFRCFMV